MFSLYGSSYTKLKLSIITNPSVNYGLVWMENENLEKQEPENHTKNFVYYLIGCTAINQMVKCNQQGKFYFKFIKMYIFYVQNVDEFFLCRPYVGIWVFVVDIFGSLFLTWFDSHFWLDLTQYFWSDLTHIERIYFWLQSHYLSPIPVKLQSVPNWLGCLTNNSTLKQWNILQLWEFNLIFARTL